MVVLKNMLRAGLAGLCVAAALFLGGCGGEQHQSEEEFLRSLQASDDGESAEGSLPPAGESMEKAPRIRVETTEMDVGMIANDKLHRTKLKVSNDGQMPLKLVRVDTTCACTQGFIRPDGNELKAGGETWIDVVLDPYRIPGFHSRQVLTIISNAPNQPAVQVDVTAGVDPEYALEAEEIDLGEIEKGAVVEKRLRFRQLQEEPVTLQKVEPLTRGRANPKIPGVSGEIVEIPEEEWDAPGKREYDIVLTIGPQLPAGPFERSIYLFVDLERFQHHRIQIQGTVMAPYDVSPQYPARAMLKTGKDFDGIHARFTFEGNGPVALTNIEPGHPALAAEAVPGASPNEAHLMVTLEGEPPAEALDEPIHLRVETGGQSYDEFVGVRYPGAAQRDASGGASSAGGHDGHNH